MAPSKLIVGGRTTSNESFLTTTYHPEVNEPQSNGAYPLVVQNFPKLPIQNMLITIGNPGPLPKWRGVAGEGWLFIDEIEVYGHEK